MSECVGVQQQLEKGTPEQRARAAVSISVLHFLRGEAAEADAAADAALHLDGRDAAALLSKVCISPTPSAICPKIDHF